MFTIVAVSIRTAVMCIKYKTQTKNQRNHLKTLFIYLFFTGQTTPADCAQGMRFVPNNYKLLLRGFEPATFDLNPVCYHCISSYPLTVVCTLYTQTNELGSLQHKGDEETKQTLTLMFSLPVLHNDTFHCLFKGKFLVSSRQARVGPASPGCSLHSLQPQLTSNS